MTKLPFQNLNSKVGHLNAKIDDIIFLLHHTNSGTEKRNGQRRCAGRYQNRTELKPHA